jgi:predicted TIM-barrel fold metal-dependent hydrolase
MHVFGPLDRFPGVASPRYDYPGGSLEQYNKVAGVLGIERIVLVQSSFYGLDNRCLLQSLDDMGTRARATVFLPKDVMPRQIDELHIRGVRGLRLDFFKMHDRGASTQEYISELRHAERLVRDVGWHIELYAPGIVVRNLTAVLGESRATICVNHMGYMRAEDGLTDVDFDHFLASVKTGLLWVKLTGHYRIVANDEWNRADVMAQQLIREAPSRVVWGTDWPHIPYCDKDTGRVLARFSQWCPNETVRTQVLVGNPARLYDFA